MGLFVNDNGSWVEMTEDKPVYTKVGSVWRTAFKMFYKDGSTWKQVYVGDTTPPSGDVTSISGTDRWKNTMTVNYDAATDDYTGVAVYKLQVNINDGGWADIPNLNLNTSGGSYDYDSTNAGSNAKVQFRTRKVDGAGNEGEGTAVTQYRDDTKPTIQLTPTLSANTTTLTITYRGATDSRSGLASYYAQIEEYGTGSWSTLTGVTLDASSTTSNRTATWTISSTYYKKNIRIRLVATDNAGNTQTATSAAFQFDNTAPTAGSCTVTGNTSLSVAYGGASDPTTVNNVSVHSTGVTSYRIEKKVNNGSWVDHDAILTAGGTYPYTVPAADYNKTIHFRTRATDRHGNTQTGAEGSRYVDTTSPSGLAGYTPTASANGNNMNFTFPALTDSTSVSSYVLQIKDGSTYTNTNVTGLSINGGTSTYTVDDNDRGSVLTFRLRAVDERNNPAESNDFSFQTRPKGTFYFNPSGHGTVAMPTNGYTSPSWRSLTTVVNGWNNATSGNNHGFFFYGTQFKDTCLGFAPDSGTLTLTRNTNGGCSGVVFRVSTTSLGSQPSSVPANSGGWLTIGQNDPYYATATNPTVGNSVNVTLTSNMLSKIASNAQSSFMIHPNSTAQSTQCPGATTYVVHDQYDSSHVLKQFAGFVALTFD